MPRPIRRSDLGRDQAVAGFLVWRAKQSLGKAHEREALGSRETELLQKALDGPTTPRPAGGADQGLRLQLDPGARIGVERRGSKRCRQSSMLIRKLQVIELIEGHVGI